MQLIPRDITQNYISYDLTSRIMMYECIDIVPDKRNQELEVSKFTRPLMIVAMIITRYREQSTGCGHKDGIHR